MLNNILDSYKGNNKRQNNKGNRITKKRVLIVKPKDVKCINVKKCNVTVIITLIDEEINFTVWIGRILVVIYRERGLFDANFSVIRISFWYLKFNPK